jgi:hypothetical protein
MPASNSWNLFSTPDLYIYSIITHSIQRKSDLKKTVQINRLQNNVCFVHLLIWTPWQVQIIVNISWLGVTFYHASEKKEWKLPSTAYGINSRQSKQKSARSVWVHERFSITFQANMNAQHIIKLPFWKGPRIWGIWDNTICKLWTINNIFNSYTGTYCSRIIHKILLD